MRGDVKSVVGAFVKVQRRSRRAPAGWKRKELAKRGSSTLDCRTRKETTCDAFLMGETLVLEFDVEFSRAFPSANFTVEINRKEMGMRVLSLQSEDSGFAIHQVLPGRRRFRVEIPNCMLYPTSYEIMICLWEHGKTFDYVDGIVEFSMIQSDVTREHPR